MPGNETFARHLAEAGAWELGHLETRRFPDNESYVRILSDLADRPVTLVCTLARPDDRFLPLAFVAHAARVLGASEVTLVAPHISPICGRIGGSSRASLSALALPHFPASTEPAQASAWRRRPRADNGADIG